MKKNNFKKVIKVLILITLGILLFKTVLNLSNQKIFAINSCVCDTDNKVKGITLDDYINSTIPSADKYRSTIDNYRSAIGGNNILCINNGEATGIVAPHDVGHYSGTLLYKSDAEIPLYGICMKGSTSVGYKGDPSQQSKIGFICCPSDGNNYLGDIDNIGYIYCCPKDQQVTDFSKCKDPSPIYSWDGNGDNGKKNSKESSQSTSDNYSLFSSSISCSKVGSDYNQGGSIVDPNANNVPPPINTTCDTTRANNCSVTCPDLTKFSDNCPSTFNSCSQWSLEACKDHQLKPTNNNPSTPIPANPNVTPVVTSNIPLTGDAKSCISARGTCTGPNQVNLFDAIDKGRISLNGLDANYLRATLVDSYTNHQSGNNLKHDPYSICIDPTQISGFINYYADEAYDLTSLIIGTFFNNGINNDKQLIENNIDLHPTQDTDIPRVCTSNLSPQQARNSGHPGDWQPWGCCPSGYYFTSSSSLFGPGNGKYKTAEVYDNVGCCESSSANDWSSNSDSTQRCKQDGKVLGVKSINFAEGINQGMLIRGTFLGQIIGRGDKIISLGNLPQNTQVCPSSASCAITDSASLGEAIKSNATEKDGVTISSLAGKKVISPSLLVSTGGLNCLGCFSEGGVIGYLPKQSDGNRYTLLCKNGKQSPEILVNDSVEQTLACDKADPTNKISCRSCLNSGGLWLAVGCVDPTPLGLITGIIRIALGIMGGVSLILIIIAGIALQSGDEKRIEDAKKELIAVLSGVAVLVFSVLILRIIGVNVLDILPKGSV